jgi:proline dehydrogenase
MRNIPRVSRLKSFIIDLMPSFLVRLFARPYVSGDSVEKGIAKTDELYMQGVYSTLDLLGEAVDTRELVEINIETYTNLIEQVGTRDYVTVSLKPTSLGLHESVDYCLESLRRVLTVAQHHKVPVTIDMEDHPFTDVTLDLYTTLIKEDPTLGTVLQSRLFRTEKDIEDLSTVGGRIRMCIGIYNEPEEIALQHKPDMKEKMLEFSEVMLDIGFYLEFATHDQQTIDQMLQIAQEKGYTREQLEFQQLLGVPMSKKQQEIMERGYITRLYVPFATNWKYAIPYLKRRLNNNPRMAWYVISQTVGKLFGRS